MGSSKKSTIAFKQMLGAHWLWTLGPIDKLVKLMFGEDKRVAWQGEQAESGTIIVDAENLFGGKKKEGGVSGAVDVEFGDAAQGRNAYLQSQLSNDIPAYRGLLGLVFRGISSGGFYFGTNPYLKKVSILAQRIHVRQDGIAQWYDETAEIVDSANSEAIFTESFEGDLSAYTLDGADAASVYTLAADSYGQALNVDNGASAVLNRITYSGLPRTAKAVTLRFKVTSVAAGDCCRFDLLDGAGELILRFIPLRSSSFDALRRPSFLDGGDNFIGSAAVDTGAWYEASITLTDTTAVCSITKTDTQELVGSVSISGAFTLIDNYRFRLISDPAIDGSVVRYDDVVFYDDVQTGDINPAHFIREALTDPDWGRGLPEVDIGVSFTTAADTFYAEGMGISLRWDRQMSIEEFVEVLLSHADAALYEDRTTGKFELKPIRADYDPDLLDVLDKTVISKIDKPNWRVFGDLPTAVTVVYTDPDNGEDASVTHSNPALAAMQGKEKETTLQYPGFRRADLAARVAARDSRALGSEIFTTDLVGSRALLDYNAGDVIKLNWPEYGISNMIMRVIQGPKVEGRNKIRLAVSTDVYALPDLAPVATPEGEWVDPSQPPEATTLHIAVEAPYYELVQRNGEAATDAIIAENQDLGYILATAARPAYAINASLYVDAGAGYEDSGVVDFCPYAELGTAVGPTDTVWTITGGIDLDQVRIGSHAQINGENFRVDAISAGEDQLTVGRGVLDTVPAPTHAAGSSIFFWDDYAEGDGTEYVTAESIDVKVVPQSGAGASDLADITADTVVMATRAFRPYPPGNLLIDTIPYPGSINAASFSATVAHRDRTQQTSGTLQDTTYGNIGPEVGVTYTWTLYRTDTEAVLQSYSGDSVTSKAFAPGYSGEVRLEVKAVRDSEDSWQSLTHTFQLGGTFNRITEDTDARITESGDIRTTE